MKFLKFPAILMMVIFSALPVLAWEPAIRYINIDAELRKDGSMDIVEHWDCTPASGTEWYLVRSNLKDASVSNLRVSDENGDFVNTGDWDVNASMAQKTGKCGLHRISDGCEICWGVGSYGPHKYTVSYKVDKALKSMDDYDMLHWQFVSNGLSSRVDSIKVSLSAEGIQLDTTIARIWGFGWRNGSTSFENGKVIARSGRFDRDCSIILMLRLDKNLLFPQSRINGSFEDHQKKAFKGSSFEEEDGNDALWFVFSFLMIVCSIGFAIYGVQKSLDKRKKRIYGIEKLPKKPDWCRSIPFSGNIGEAWFAWAWQKGRDDGQMSIIAAIMLRFIQHGNLIAVPGRRGKSNYQLNANASDSWMSSYEREFYQLTAKAAGKDNVLEEKEFRRWAEKNSEALKLWADGMKKEVAEQFSRDGLTSVAGGYYSYDSLDLNPEGQRKAMETLGFCQYLKDYTIINERSTSEIALWQDYLCMAAIFGIAEQVAKDFKNICPEWQITTTAANGSQTVYDAQMMYDFCRMSRLINLAGTSSLSTTNTAATKGFGGGVSFGGGGGFSGGGFGGGSR